MSIKKLTNDDFVTTNWSGGTTTQVYIEPLEATVAEKNFDFRISTATVEVDESVFTQYEDYNRFITPLTGSLKLVKSDETVDLLPFDIYAFGGEEPITSYGKVRDFNLMVKKGKQGSLRRVKFNKSLDFDVQSKTCVMFAIGSKVTIKAGDEVFELENMEAILFKDENITVELSTEDISTLLIATVS